MYRDDIPINELSNGVMSTFDYSYIQLKSCVLLYDNKHYPMSIISAIFSIEESQKGLMFMENIRDDNKMNKSYYHEKVSNHLYKSRFGVKLLIKSENEIRGGNSEPYIEYLRNLRNSGLNLMTSQQQQSMYEDFSLFPQIRSYFTYTTWKFDKKIWLDFNKQLNISFQGQLSLYLLCLANAFLNVLKNTILQFVHEITRNEYPIRDYLADHNMRLSNLYNGNFKIYEESIIKIYHHANLIKLKPIFVNYYKSQNFKNFQIFLNDEHESYYNLSKNIPKGFIKNIERIIH